MTYRIWPAELKSLKPIQDFIEPLALKAGVSNKKLLSISLIVEEIVVNIIKHAYPKADSGEIGIDFRSSENEISIFFMDRGIPFDPMDTAAPDIKKSIVERKVGGLGIFMVRKIADDVSYIRCGNQNILTVRFSCDIDIP